MPISAPTKPTVVVRLPFFSTGAVRGLSTLDSVSLSLLTIRRAWLALNMFSLGGLPELLPVGLLRRWTLLALLGMATPAEVEGRFAAEAEMAERILRVSLWSKEKALGLRMASPLSVPRSESSLAPLSRGVMSEEDVGMETMFREVLWRR